MTKRDRATAVRRLRKLADFLAKLPHDGKLKMEQWANSTKIGTTKPMCSTSACVAGWATVVFPKELTLRRQFVPWLGRLSIVLCHRKERSLTHEPAFTKAMRLPAPIAEAIAGSENTTPKEKARQLRRVARLMERRDPDTISHYDIREICGSYEDSTF